MKLIPFNSGQTVSQADLETLLQLDGQIDTLKLTRDRVAAAIIAKLATGGKVDPGARTCRLEESVKGKSRHQRLIVR